MEQSSPELRSPMSGAYRRDTEHEQTAVHITGEQWITIDRQYAELTRSLPASVAAGRWRSPSATACKPRDQVCILACENNIFCNATGLHAEEL